MHPTKIIHVPSPHDPLRGCPGEGQGEGAYASNHSTIPPLPDPPPRRGRDRERGILFTCTQLKVIHVPSPTTRCVGTPGEGQGEGAYASNHSTIPPLPDPPPRKGGGNLIFRQLLLLLSTSAWLYRERKENHQTSALRPLSPRGGGTGRGGFCLHAPN